jgi:rubrerythrin
MPVLEKILNEEKSHLSQLNELKKKMLNMKQPG